MLMQNEVPFRALFLSGASALTALQAVVFFAVVIGTAAAQEQTQTQDVSPIINQRIITPNDGNAPTTAPTDINPMAIGKAWTIEAESLVDSATTFGGTVTVQQMNAFGPGWSNNAQLFWRPTLPFGSNLKLPISSRFEGAYLVILHYTSAPDYGKVQAKIWYRVTAGNAGQRPRFGETQPILIDGYSPQVQGPHAVEFRIPRTDGAMELRLTIANRNSQSSGLLVGIDRVEFVRY